MPIPLKKLSNGFSLPEYGLGTWTMGGNKNRNPDNDDQADIEAIKMAIDAGVTHIDTAEIYADGYAETLIGQAIKDYDRSKLFLASKAFTANLTYDGIIQACQNSLQRLGTDYLDLYLLHRYNPDLSLSESLRALDELKHRGLVKEIGACNFNVQHLAEAQSHTKNKIVCDQVHYNLQFREPEINGLLKYCQENDVMIVAWCPLNRETLLQDVPQIIQQMCVKYNKTPAQIALSWLVSQPNVAAISKTGSQRHLDENLGAVGWHMDQDDIEKIRKEYPDQRKISDNVPLG